MECLISFAQGQQDIILAHALSDIVPSDVFWIDVGANDPVNISVTLLFYLRGGHGINIEPQLMYQKRYALLRERDINLPVGIGETEGTLVLHGSGDTATMTDEYAGRGSIKVKVTTLTKIFQDYVPDNQAVHFLKIDVEGFERECIMGLDLSRYRPWIICTECLPHENCEDYEPKLLRFGYRFVYNDGQNRYYVLKEHTEIIKQFADLHRLNELYEIVSLGDATKWLSYEQSTSWRITRPLRKAVSIWREMKSKWKNRN